TGEEVTRAAMVGEDPVARLEGMDDADRGGLLPDRRAGSRGAGRPVDLDQPALVRPDQQHRFEQRKTGGCWFAGHDFSMRSAGEPAKRSGRNVKDWSSDSRASAQAASGSIEAIMASSAFWSGPTNPGAPAHSARLATRRSVMPRAGCR